MKKLIAPAIFLFIACVVSLFYVGITITLIQLSCIAVGLGCLLVTHTLFTRSFQPVRLFSVACLMLLLISLGEVALAYYAQDALKDPLRIIKAADYFQRKQHLSSYALHAALLITQTLLILLYVRGSLKKSLLISAVSYAATVLLVYLAWEHLIEAQTKIKYVVYAVEDLLKIYTRMEGTKEYEVFEFVRKKVLELSA